MENLPIDILEDILSRLPFEVDLHAKHVCTTWRSIIIRNKSEKPGFLFAHSEHHRSDINIRQLFYEDEYNHDDHSKIGMNSNYYYDKNFITEIEHSRTIKESGWGHVMVGSCNGLVCFGKHIFRKHEAYIFLICNPLTGESIILPETKHFSIIYFASGFGNRPRPETNDYKVLARGFGYCPCTNDYKVVAIFHHKQEREIGHVLVYTLGTGKWRYSGFTDRCAFNYSLGIHSNGALFWLHRSNGRLQESEIVAFDLEGEQFHYIALPSSEDLEYIAKYNSPLKLLGGNNNLYLVHSITRASRTDIWAYKSDNKIVSHWLKEFSIQLDCARYFEAFAITRSNAVLWIYDKGKSLYWYDPKTSTFNKLRDIDNNDYRERVYVEAIPHTQSNVSLKDLGETNVTSLNDVGRAFYTMIKEHHFRNISNFFL